MLLIINPHAILLYLTSTMCLQTITETKSEREARGHPVGHDVPYAAMGGITGFSSLAEGYMRLDDSGIGAPSREFLEKPIGTICIKKTTHLTYLRPVSLDLSHMNDANTLFRSLSRSII